MTWTTLLVSNPQTQIAPDGTAFDISGQSDAPVVALIHGLGLCRQLWDQMLPAFAGFRVLRYDLYGHGDSAAFDGTVSLRVYADQLAALLRHLHIPAADVVGFSIGGMINRRFAMDYPDMVNRLVIMNSPHNRGETQQEAVEGRALAARGQGAFATIDAAITRWFTPDYIDQGRGPALIKTWRGYVDDESYAQAAWVLAHGVRELIAPDPPLRVPSLVLTCENDVGSTPQMTHDIAAENANAKAMIVPTYKHLGLLEAPDVFTAPILAFLGPCDDV